MILLPRNKDQSETLQKTWQEWIRSKKIDGINLIWFSDLVVSGGGTMNREAAALGVPVYSIFRGKIGAVDRQLQKEGRLVLIESDDDIWEKIAIKHRQKNGRNPSERPALRAIVGGIEEILRLTNNS